MGFLDGLLKAIPIVGPVVGAIGNAISNKVTSDQNIKYQKEINEQNIALTREQWAREDTEIQRRLADAKAAGVNPMAVLGGASSSQPLRVDAPKAEDPKYGNIALAPVQALQMSQDFATKDAEIYNLKAEGRLKTAEVNEKHAVYGSKIVDSLNQLKTMYENGAIPKSTFGRIVTDFANAFGINSMLGDYDDLYAEVLSRALRYTAGPLFSSSNVGNSMEDIDKYIESGNNLDRKYKYGPFSGFFKTLNKMSI